MSLYGQANGNTLKGAINRLTELRGYSAYEIAVIHGFVGTEEEWVDSITGGGGVRSFNGREGYIKPLAGDYTAEMVGARPNNWTPSYSEVGADKKGAAAKVGDYLVEQINAKVFVTSIALTPNWIGEKPPYYQIVTVPNMTGTKVVDLQPTPEQINVLMENGTAGLQAVNSNGTVMVYVFGEKPAEAMAIQAIVTDLNDIKGGGWENDDDDPDIPDVPDEPDEPVLEKLAAPVIHLETDAEPDDGNTPAILGVAILGRTILGDTGGNVQKLSAPVIRLETESGDDPVPTKLEAPVISLYVEPAVPDEPDEPEEPDEPVVEKLVAPVIELVIIQPEEPVVVKLTTPEIKLVEV